MCPFRSKTESTLVFLFIVNSTDGGHYPSGGRADPYYHSRILLPVVNYLRKQGIRLVCYADEWLLMAKPGLIKAHKEMAIQTLTRLGWKINWDKSILIPTPKIPFIGYILFTEGPGSPIIRIPAERVRQLRKDIKRLLRKTDRTVTARHLARAMCCYGKAVAPGKLLLCNAYRLLSTRADWNSVLTLDTTKCQDLEWWHQALGPGGWNGASLTPRPIDAQLETDASDSGWGAYLAGQRASGFWTKRASTKSINYRELLAVLLAIESFSELLRNKRVEVL